MTTPAPNTENQSLTKLQIGAPQAAEAFLLFLCFLLVVSATLLASLFLSDENSTASEISITLAIVALSATAFILKLVKFIATTLTES